MMKPKKLKIEIGGYHSPSVKLIWKNGALHYYNYPYGFSGEGKVIKPSDKQWETFWISLEQLNVWEWRESYEANILDGVQWLIEIAVDDKNIKSYGYNSYPEADGRISGEDGYQTELFKDFINAVSRLIGIKLV